MNEPKIIKVSGFKKVFFPHFIESLFWLYFPPPGIRAPIARDRNVSFGFDIKKLYNNLNILENSSEDRTPRLRFVMS